MYTGSRPRRRWSLFGIPTVLRAPDTPQQPSDQGPAAKLQVARDLTKMIAVFAEDWMGVVDPEVSRVQSIDVHNWDFKFS